MKKNIVLFILITIFFNTYLSATEIWNGFTTDLTKEQTKEKIQQMYNVKQILIEDESKISKYPDKVKIYDFHVRNTISGLRFRLDDVGIDEISVNFYNDTLYAMKIVYKADKEDLKNKIYSHFGKYQTFSEYDDFFGITYHYDYWIKNGVIVVYGRGTACSFTDEKTRNILINIYNQVKQEQKQKEEDEKKKKADSIVF